MFDSPAPVLGFILSLSSIGLSLLAGLVCALLGGAAMGIKLAGQQNFQAKGDNRWGMVMRDSLCWPYNFMGRGDTVLVCDSGNNRALLWQLSDEVKQ